MADLRGKRVLITGGARHLGRAIAMGMAAAGARVAFTYLNSKEEAGHTLEELEKLGAGPLAVPCDVRKKQSIESAVQTVAASMGGLDILVNNAGFFEAAPFGQLTEEQWDNMFSTNVRGPFLVSQQCLPLLRSSRGRIVHLGSLGGEKAWATHAHYCSSKAALHMLTRVMAKALAPEVAVNCVAPGTIDLGDGDRQFFQRMATHTPMRRNGTADEVVSAVLFFATATEFITGQFLYVDGGLSQM
ncbi:MAG TPA: SDR family oxidoreductase [Candidatus Saccharimonadales bacterium]|jgi:NAD(P)-dependent dehydrogenase (short-subunit alcohol dehydrogenase family)|nr:SDR family oxidoreductase [Candidatus Saccharimonadales bacterium]